MRKSNKNTYKNTYKKYRQKYGQKYGPDKKCLTWQKKLRFFCQVKHFLSVFQIRFLFQFLVYLRFVCAFIVADYFKFLFFVLLKTKKVKHWQKILDKKSSTKKAKLFLSQAFFVSSIFCFKSKIKEAQPMLRIKC